MNFCRHSDLYHQNDLGNYSGKIYSKNIQPIGILLDEDGQHHGKS